MSQHPAWPSRTAIFAYSAGAGLIAACLGMLLSWPLAAADGAQGEAGLAAKSGYVGSGTCRSCHQDIYARWKGSHHALAMQPATATTVLGDFDNAEFDYHGVRSRFFRKDGRFFVETDGPDGDLQTYEIKDIFGVYPLQQYLIAFADGRVQALSIAWDARSKEQGGQRWFHLYPHEKIGHTDPLHWTGLQQNWNFMCAECHTTNFHKNYDAGSDGYATTWSEMDVGCESCHGPGAGHAAWVGNRKKWWQVWRGDDPLKGFSTLLDDRAKVIWTIDPATGNAKPSTKPGGRLEVEMCGRCHARRGTFSEAWKPGANLSDSHFVALLRAGLFEDDGQMRDEVYNYQSFKQSKMYAAGVTCSDCHDPHSTKLKATGAEICQQCHDAAKYASAKHHFHGDVSPEVTCVSCHMPQRTYMVVDPRHDHSFRIPRPDLSAKLGTPNACNDCHRDETAQWAEEAIERVHGKKRKGFQTYAEAFHAARNETPDAAALLFEVTRDGNAPAIARATAYAELGPRLSPAMLDQFRKGLSDADPIVRIGALRGLEPLPAQARWPLAGSLLTDPIRAVRIEAASFLAPVPATEVPADDKQKFEAAAAEFIAAQRLNADRPESRTNLGNFFAGRGQADEAETEYRAALRLEPRYVQAAVNLADLHRAQGREAEAEAILRQALAVAPEDAAVQHALGLTLVRLQRAGEALELLGSAAKLAPSQTRYAYVHGIALNSAGRVDDALDVLKANLARHPGDQATLAALISINREQGDVAAALHYAEELARVNPRTPGLAQMLQDLGAGAGSPGSEPAKP